MNLQRQEGFVSRSLNDQKKAIFGPPPTHPFKKMKN